MSNTGVKRSQVAAGRYSWHPNTQTGVCHYCGALGDSVDHVPPLMVLYTGMDCGVAHKHLWLVQSCIECNTALSAFPGETLQERRDHLAKFYMRRYRRVLSIPRWSDEELDQMGPVMRDDIANKAALGRYIKARISRLKGYVVATRL